MYPNINEIHTFDDNIKKAIDTLDEYYKVEDIDDIIESLYDLSSIYLKNKDDGMMWKMSLSLQSNINRLQLGWFTSKSISYLKEAKFILDKYLNWYV